MRITFLGTGALLGSADRSSAGILVEMPDGAVLLDCGPGAVKNLLYAGLSAGDLRAVLISHLHLDHLAGLWPLFHVAAMSASVLPEIIGPRGMVEVVTKVYDLLTAQAMQVGREAPRAGRSSEVRTTGDFKLLDFRIRARTTQHEARTHALCYRLEADGQSIVYSGDTTPQYELFANLASGVDLLIHETYSEAELKSSSDGAPPGWVARRAQAFLRNHTSAADAAKIATVAGAKRLVLTHIPGWNTVDAILKEARPHFSGGLTVAHDGLVIEL